MHEIRSDPASVLAADVARSYGTAVLGAAAQDRLDRPFRITRYGLGCIAPCLRGRARERYLDQSTGLRIQWMYNDPC